MMRSVFSTRCLVSRNWSTTNDKWQNVMKMIFPRLRKCGRIHDLKCGRFGGSSAAEGRGGGVWGAGLPMGESLAVPLPWSFFIFIDRNSALWCIFAHRLWPQKNLLWHTRTIKQQKLCWYETDVPASTFC